MKTLPLLLLLFALPALGQDLALREFEKKGFAALNAKDYAACAPIFAAATIEYRPEPSPPFLAARCYAGLGIGQAPRLLKRAIERGFRNCRAIARDENLAKFTKLMARCEANAEAFVRRSNPELLAAYLGDRADRSGEITDPAAVKKRDEMRHEVVRIAIARRSLKTADDYLHAALVMQHGSSPDDYAAARDLAKKAVELRPWLAEARWLYAAATDRYLQSIGKPQIFGTQYRFADGKWTLEPFDPSAITNQERARWRTHSLAERRRFIEELNQRE